jgi:Aspartyl protease
LIVRGGHSRLQNLISETAPPEPRRTPFCYLPVRFVAKHRRPLASVPPVKILKISQLLNLRENENRCRQNIPLIKIAPRKVKRFNIRYRRRQRRKTQKLSSAQNATATIEPDSIDEFIVFSTRTLHAMALRNRNKYCWNGACIDTGAQRTVIGLAQARAYSKFFGIPFVLSNKKRVFVFGVDKRNSLGILHMRLQTPNGIFIMLEVDVVPTNVPMILGLDVLDKFGLSADTVHNILHCTAEDRKLTLVRKFGHVDLEWSATYLILYTKSELQKLPRNFSHPSTQTLFALLKRAKSDDLDASTRAVLSDIEDVCGTCQRYGSKPLHLKTTLSSGEKLS